MLSTPIVERPQRDSALMLRPNGLPFSCRERAALSVKMRTISCAKRSAGTAGWAARLGSLPPFKLAAQRYLNS
jgi:hypothetical protein